MAWLIEMLLANALVAMPLAGVAWLARRLVRWPAVRHALWVLVLVKLITPPVVPVHIPVPASWSGFIGVHAPQRPSILASVERPMPASDSHHLDITRTVSRDANARDGIQVQPIKSGNLAGGATQGSTSRAVLPSSAVPIVSSTNFAMPGLELSSAASFGRLISIAMIGVWVIGSLIWWTLNARRIARFGHRLRGMGLRDRLLEKRASELAARLGLKRVPQVHLIDMGVAPMLWGCGSWTKIVLPSRLIERLDVESRDALLLHELAHFRRGDQWIRLLELVVTGLYWWYPIVWWAKREIAVHEEECCDALAVSNSLMPRRYADVLLETLDFIADYRLPAVPVSSAISDVPMLERRLRLIMAGGIPWSLSNWGRFGLICLIAMLPYQPLLMASMPSARHVDRQPLVDLPAMVSESMVSIDQPVDHRAIVAGKFASAMPDSTRTLHLPPVTEHPLLETGPGREVWGNTSSLSGRYELTALSGGRVHLNDRVRERVIDMTAEGITAAVFLNQDHWLAGTRAGDVRIYDAASGAAISFLGRHPAEVTSVSWMPNVRRAITASSDGRIFVWDLEANAAIVHQWNMQRPISVVRPSPDGRLLAVACGNWLSKSPATLLMDLSSGSGSGRILRELPAALPIGAVAFRPDGQLLFTADWEGRVTLWEIETGALVGYGRIPKDVVSATTFSPDDSALAATEMVDESNGSSQQAALQQQLQMTPPKQLE